MLGWQMIQDIWYLCFSSVQFSRSVVSNSLRPNGLQPARLPCPLKLMSIESVMPSNHLIFCHPLLLLPSVFPSIRVSSNESLLHFRWPKHWSFSFSIRPSNEYSGLISFRMDWLDLLAVQGTLKSLLQHLSGSSAFSKTSLNIRKFTVHVLLKAGLENFKHYFTSMWDECVVR